MTKEELTKQVRDLVVNGKSGKALELLSRNDHLFEFSKQETVTNLAQRLNNLNREQSIGVLNFSDASVRRNQIVSSILSLVGADHPVTMDVNLEATPISKNPVSFKMIKDVLKRLKDKKGKIDYAEAVDWLSDLF